MSPVPEELSPVQQERAAALSVAREVVETRGAASGFGAASREVDPMDLVTVADYIITGHCNWLDMDFGRPNGTDVQATEARPAEPSGPMVLRSNMQFPTTVSHNTFTTGAMGPATRSD